MSLILPPEVSLKDETITFLNNGPKNLLINNEWVAAADGATFATHNPATGQELVQVASAGTADVDAAVNAARAALTTGPWAKMSGQDRADFMMRVADLIDKYAAELGELETLDNGMPIRSAQYGNMPLAARHFRYYAGWATKLEGSTIPVHYPNQFVYTRREPMGVVGLIIPWNFPFLMCAWKLAPALACGNTAILKPAEETPLTALRLGEILIEAGMPAGVVNILPGPGVPTGSAITAHMGIDKVAFTGSTEVGRKIMTAAANSNLKRVSLELGGKSPNVIFADADVNSATKGSMWASFSNTGQECIAGSRLFVERPVLDQVVEGLAAGVQNIRIGNGFAPKMHLGPIITPQQTDRIMGYIESGRDNGAELVAGGQRLDGDLAEGNFIAPTIFTHENDELDLVKEEIFGPVVAVTPFDDWEELVARANQTNYGLAAGVWTRDIAKAHQFAHAVQAGAVYVNQYGLFDPAVPFGGYKESGFGREMGKEALDLYTQTKTVWVSLR
ncbi:MAG TPA: aldehyde dehydrogenase family protein [Anaerolineae bacterium]|nr:aldehyde dehydrogenase family protein [Anaerolineae bacterium]